MKENLRRSASDIFHPLFVAYMFVFMLDRQKTQRMILVVCGVFLNSSLVVKILFLSHFLPFTLL